MVFGFADAKVPLHLHKDTLPNVYKNTCAPKRKFPGPYYKKMCLNFRNEIFFLHLCKRFLNLVLSLFSFAQDSSMLPLLASIALAGSVEGGYPTREVLKHPLLRDPFRLYHIHSKRDNSIPQLSASWVSTTIDPPEPEGREKYHFVDDNFANLTNPSGHWFDYPQDDCQKLEHFGGIHLSLSLATPHNLINR